jgi:hypothetical protein
MNTHHLDVTLGTPFHLERAVLPRVYGRRRGGVANVSAAATVAGAARMVR